MLGSLAADLVRLVVRLALEPSEDRPGERKRPPPACGGRGPSDPEAPGGA
jgi:hypothetical protein